MAMSISGDLVADVRLALELSLEYSLTGRGVRHGNNAYTPHAFSAYVSAVVAVEAFLNETLLGAMCRAIYQSSPLWHLSQDALERMDLLLKLVIVPQLLFGATFRRDQQPLQDFSLLYRVRNDIVHFKMKQEPPKYLAYLAQRGIAITADKAPGDYPWPAKLSCTEGIRWANNTATRIAHALVDFVPQEHRGALASHVSNFREVDEQAVARWYANPYPIRFG